MNESLAPKQYTEQEVRAAYIKAHGIAPIAIGMSEWHSDRYAGWIECAKFLGALKAEL